MATKRFRKIIDEATRAAGWTNESTFESDCNCVLESLVADLTLDEIVAAVDRQGFRAAEEYRRAAAVLKDIAERRRLARIEAREGDDAL